MITSPKTPCCTYGRTVAAQGAVSCSERPRVLIIAGSRTMRVAPKNEPEIVPRPPMMIIAR